VHPVSTSSLQDKQKDAHSCGLDHACVTQSWQFVLFNPAHRNPQSHQEQKYGGLMISILEQLKWGAKVP
jgi:hypothetical protein